MNINVLTIFPGLFESLFEDTLVGKALKNGIWSLNLINIRDFACDKHKSVDDTVYGGGPGMLFKPDVLDSAIQSIPNKTIIHMSPRGEVFSQSIAEELSQLNDLTILTSRYEGVDQRIITKYNIREISIGDYVLTGGEIPAAVLIDCVVRLLDKVLGNNESKKEESFSNYLLEHDQYTKPDMFSGMHVPVELKSGNHQLIKSFNLENSKKKTMSLRKDLWFKFIKNYLACNG